VRSMLAEIQAAIDETWPDDGGVVSRMGRTSACEEPEGMADAYWCGCAACFIHAHATAHIDPWMATRWDHLGKLPLAAAVNQAIREARLPLPLVPEPGAP
jgi:hypothetical protein